MKTSIVEKRHEIEEYDLGITIDLSECKSEAEVITRIGGVLCGSDVTLGDANMNAFNDVYSSWIKDFFSGINPKETKISIIGFGALHRISPSFMCLVLQRICDRPLKVALNCIELGDISIELASEDFFEITISIE